MFAQQFYEFGDAAFLICAQMIVNVPAEVIFPEFAVILAAVVDEIVQCIETEVPGFA